ncbi:hypothetical protein [Coxiella endosymbiont of Dermacentor marginatus]|nr:hypothetical protein [Coxiella endosymbiont of Dermacentor marginatus]
MKLTVSGNRIDYRLIEVYQTIVNAECVTVLKMTIFLNKIHTLK